MASPQYMLDTTTASLIIRGVDPALLQRLQRHPVHAVSISSLTQAELLFALEHESCSSALAAAVAAFLQHVQALPWDSEAAQRYATLRAHLQTTGTVLGTLDLLVAAQAQAGGLTLVSADPAFRQVPGLVVEDWSVVC